MTATLTRKPTRKNAEHVPTRSVPEMLRELSYLLHATRVVKQSADPRKPR